MKEVEEEAKRLQEKFGDLATLVVDELLANAYSGYDYDASAEVPYYNAIKAILDKK